MFMNSQSFQAENTLTPMAERECNHSKMRTQTEEGSTKQMASTKALCEVQLCGVDADLWAKVGHH